jgi:peptidoglycan hydrolase CwlO-like protein
MKKLAIIFSLIGLLFLAKPIFGIHNSEVELCFSNAKLDDYCEREGDDACQQILEECDSYLTDVQNEYEEDIQKTEQEKQNLANQISRLENRMSQLESEIQQSEVRIRSLGYEINSTQDSIQRMNEKIEKSRGQLSEMMRTIKRENKKSVLEILITENDLSDFFNNLATLEALSRESKSILDEVKSLRNSLETEEQRLAREREEARQYAEVQAAQKAESEQIKNQQQYLYNITEQEYQQQVTQKEFIEERAQEIRERKFELAGLFTDVEAPTFEEAYEIAKWVEGQTGIRPAFLLAVLHQESGIGKNVGQCYLKDPETAGGIEINSGRYVSGVMKPMGLAGREGDVEAFLRITRELNLDPFETPVSCPIPSVGGYGGAMGPAQFIPTTWEAYKGELANMLGRPANPWNIRDSFLASGLYLSRYGAGTKNRNDEWCAAQGYFTGRKCNPNHTFYGNNILATSDRFEEDIRIKTGD